MVVTAMTILEELVGEARDVSSDPRRLGNLIMEVSDILHSSSNLFQVHPPGVVELTENSHVAVFIGDIHGDFYSLLTILDSILPRVIDGGGVAVFLGDYIDRGYAQIETLALILLLKKHYSDRIVLLRGNHEPPEWLKPYPHDFPELLVEKFGDEGRSLYTLLSTRLFNRLPLIAFKRRGFIAVHGGPPLKCIRSSTLEEAFEVGAPGFSAETIESVLWSDPTELNIDVIPSPRGAGYLYGSRFTRRALELTGASVIVRSHEYVNGYKEAHDGLVITVFSAPLVYELKYAGVVVYEESSSGRRIEKLLVEPNYPS